MQLRRRVTNRDESYVEARAVKIATTVSDSGRKRQTKCLLSNHDPPQADLMDMQHESSVLVDIPWRGCGGTHENLRRSDEPMHAAL